MNTKSPRKDAGTHENMLITPTQNVVLIAASTAFPPRFKTSTPICEQTAFSLATAPCFAFTRYASFRAHARSSQVDGRLADREWRSAEREMKKRAQNKV